jgi:hypothetical protein
VISVPEPTITLIVPAAIPAPNMARSWIIAFGTQPKLRAVVVLLARR